MPVPRRSFVLSVEPLEGRIAMSHAAIAPPRVALLANSSDGSGQAAFLAAMRGGPGSEFITLIRKQVRNVTGLAVGFGSGLIQSINLKGFVAKQPYLLETYTGPHLDQFNPMAAGALYLSNGRLELGAIMRGPIDRAEKVTYVWGLNRGGGTPDSTGFGPTGVPYDAYVSVTRENGVITASLTDLKTGVVTPIDSSSVRINGPTIRVFLKNPKTLLPSTGLPITKYQFAFWTRGGDSSGQSGLASFLPSNGTAQVGNLGPARGPRR